MNQENYKKIGEMITFGVLTCDYQNDMEYEKHKEEASKIVAYVYNNDKDLFDKILALLYDLRLALLYRSFDFNFVKVLAFVLHIQKINWRKAN